MIMTREVACALRSARALTPDTPPVHASSASGSDGQLHLTLPLNFSASQLSHFAALNVSLEECMAQPVHAGKDLYRHAVKPKRGRKDKSKKERRSKQPPREILV